MTKAVYCAAQANRCESDMQIMKCSQTHGWSPLSCVSVIRLESYF